MTAKTRPTISKLSLLLLIVFALPLQGCSVHRFAQSPDSIETSGRPSPLPVGLSYTQPQVKPGTILPASRFSPDPSYRLEAPTRHYLQSWLGNQDALPGTNIEMSFERTGMTMAPYTLLGMFMLATIPLTTGEVIETTLSVESTQHTIYEASVQEEIKTSVSSLPWIFLMGQKGQKPFTQMASSAMARHGEKLEAWIREEQAQHEPVSDMTVRNQREWLQDNPDSLFRGVVLARIAENPPADYLIAWHEKNRTMFKDYSQYIPAGDQIWFSGPDGATPADLLDSIDKGTNAEILAARIESDGGPYPDFSDADITTFKNGGLPDSLIVAMIKTDGPSWSGGGDTGPSAEQVRNKRPDLADLVLDNTRGKYMNPWTSDGVLADWVDKAVNAEMGSAAGSAGGAAAGAYAAKQLGGGLLGQAVGGALGSKAGEAAGREAAIDEAYIRKTSDQSFRTLEHMARYLEATYSGTRHYQDAIKAANEIYPGLVKKVRQR